MLETFKARLKAKAKALGVNLSQKRIDAFADRLHKKSPDITTDEDHDAKIEELHELQPLDEVAKADDQQRSLEAKLKNKGGNSKKEEDTDPGNDPKDEDDPPPPKWAQKLMQDVESFKKGQTQLTLRDKLAAKLKGADGKDLVPPSYYKGRALPESEEQLDQFVEEIKTDWNAFRQEQINAGFMSETKPPSANVVGGSGKAVEDDIKAWADKNKPKEPAKA
ncbi:MAG: hypothetical protein ACK40M_04315 [Flavobacteriales bacterium]